MMSWHRWSLWKVLTVFSLIWIVGCHRGEKLGPEMQHLVDQAKASGRNDFSFTMRSAPGGTGWSFEQAARRFDWVVAKAKVVGAATTSQNYIETWHVFASVKQLTGSPRDERESCNLSVPDGINLLQTDLAVPLAYGDLTVLPGAIGRTYTRYGAFTVSTKSFSQFKKPELAPIRTRRKGRDFLVMELLEGETLQQRLITRVAPTRQAGRVPIHRELCVIE